MERILHACALLTVCVGEASPAIPTSTECSQAQAIELQGHPYLTTLIPCNYTKEHPPPTKNGEPVKVEFTMYIQDINSINAADMDFRVDLFLHMTWLDSRLTLQGVGAKEGDLDHLTLPAYTIDHLWTPDPYVTNAKDAAITKLTTTYASVTLYKNHTVRYSARVYSTLACQMEFHRYPMDVQTCAMIMQSFMYSPEQLEFYWRPWSPVMINKELKLLQFQLRQPLNNYVHLSNQDELGHGDRKVRRLIVELEFAREIGHHLVQTFVPSFLVVALSWFSFWLGLEAIPGRVTLLVTSLLTITTLFTGIKEGLPPVAYVKAIDVWMAGCMVFIFAALGEFVVVRVLNVKHKENLSVVGQQQQQQQHQHHALPAPPVHNYRATTATSHRPTPPLNAATVVGDRYICNNGTVREASAPTSIKVESEEASNSYKRVTVLPRNYYHHHHHHNSNNHNNTNKIADLRENGLGTAAVPAWDPESGGPSFPPDVSTSPTTTTTTTDVTTSRRFKLGRISLQWTDDKTGEVKILWKEIDKASRIGFPLMFLLFMIIYFPILISRIF